MNARVIGNPQTFAIEYLPAIETTYPPKCQCRLWLAGVCLGDPECNIFTNSIWRELKGLLANRKSLDTLISIPSTPVQFLDLWQKGSSAVNGNGFLLIEGFDFFLKLRFRLDDAIRFVFCLHPNARRLPEFANCPDEVFVADVQYAMLEEVITEFGRVAGLE